MGFKYFFYVHPYLGNDTIWRAYFSNGLKPPTRISFIFGLKKSRFSCWLGMELKGPPFKNQIIQTILRYPQIIHFCCKNLGFWWLILIKISPWFSTVKPSQQNRYFHRMNAQDAQVKWQVLHWDSLVGLSQEISHTFPTFGMKVMRSSWNLWWIAKRVG